jgi:hypothetical protein
MKIAIYSDLLDGRDIANNIHDILLTFGIPSVIEDYQEPVETLYLVLTRLFGCKVVTKDRVIKLINQLNGDDLLYKTFIRKANILYSKVGVITHNVPDLDTLDMLRREDWITIGCSKDNLPDFVDLKIDNTNSKQLEEDITDMMVSILFL